MNKGITNRRRREGQSLVECAIVLPLLLLLAINVINFGGFFYAWISVSNAARAGAQYYTTAGISIAGLAKPAAAAVQTLVLQELEALPYQTSIQTCVSASNDATVSCNKGSAPASAPPAADTAEGSPAITYVIGAVDVTYTYQPIVPAWDFAGLNVHLTIPPTSIHRQAKMRFLQ